jgi:hypothetical protein
MVAMADPNANATEVARRLGVTTTTLYAYVNGDGTVKQTGQALSMRHDKLGTDINFSLLLIYERILTVTLLRWVQQYVPERCCVERLIFSKADRAVRSRRSANVFTILDSIVHN